MHNKTGVFWRGFVAVMVLLTSLLPTAVSANDQPSGGIALVIVDGKQIEAKEGTVVATAAHIPGSDNFIAPNITVIVRGDNNIAFISVGLKTLDDGEIIVDKVVFDRAPHPEPATPKDAIQQTPIAISPISSLKDQQYQINTLNAGQYSMALLSDAHYRGWAEHNYYDPVGLALTIVHTGLDYYDSGTEVYGGSNSNDWTHIVGDGWYTNNTAAYWWPDGPSHVYNNENSDFGWWGGSYYHHQGVQFDAWPGDDWGYAATFSGELVWHGSQNFTGGRYTP